MAYSARADIEARFGVSNVSVWADLDNDEDATKITNRIAAAIAWADAYIEGIMRGSHFRIPIVTLAGGTPTIVTDLSAKLAGLWLYEARGSKDFDTRTRRPYHRYAFMRADVRRQLEDLRTGRLQTDAV
jgi:phage gp36-like protein